MRGKRDIEGEESKREKRDGKRKGKDRDKREFYWTMVR